MIDFGSFAAYDFSQFCACDSAVDGMKKKKKKSADRSAESRTLIHKCPFLSSFFKFMTNFLLRK